MSKNTFALIIGVDDYTSFDPDGNSNLKGAVNDARRWHDFLVNTAGLAVPEENIKLGITGVTRDIVPDRNGILEGIKWLTGKMTKNASGLIVLCGHGMSTIDSGEEDWLGLSAAFCPMDVTAKGDEIQNTLRFDEIEYFLQKDGVAQNVTVVFDACFSNKKAPRNSARGLLGVAAHRNLPALEGSAAPSNIRSRLLLACEPDTHAYEFLSHGGWHGAFSTALLDVLERWNVQKDGDLSWVRVSYGKLIHRSRTLLDGLGVPQSPMLVAYPQVSLVPFLRAGMEHGDHLNSVEPDADLGRLEVSPGADWFRVLTLETSVTGGSWTLLGTCLVLGRREITVSSGTTYYPGVEYWFLHTSTSVINIDNYKLTVTQISNFPKTLESTLNGLQNHIPVVSCGYFKSSSDANFKSINVTKEYKTGIRAVRDTNKTKMASLEFAINPYSPYANPQLFYQLSSKNSTLTFDQNMPTPLRKCGTDFTSTNIPAFNSITSTGQVADGVLSIGYSIVYTACIVSGDLCGPVAIKAFDALGYSLQITINNVASGQTIQIYRTIIDLSQNSEIIGSEMIVQNNCTGTSYTHTDAKTTISQQPIAYTP